MTRKCALCKETNYKNNYSFFSAPKDPEIRKKWQDALAIDNYAVSDETYVCSKHFHKDDIITHWVSGIPPHVITIKYKKCRLRPGAIPGRNYNNDTDKEMEKDTEKEDPILYGNKANVYLNSKRDQDRTSIKEENENFLIPREDRMDSDTDTGSDEILDNLRLQHKKNDRSSIEHFRKDSGTFESLNNCKMEHSDIEERRYVKSEADCDVTSSDETKYHRNISNSRTVDKTSYYFEKRTDPAEDYGVSADFRLIEDHQRDENDPFSMDTYTDNATSTGNVYIKTNSVDIDHEFYETNENELLFEDLLEVCTEVVLPRGWSCLVTSKGHATTIVYLYMEMTRKGMPFVEKQIYLKSDMVLHCSVMDQEINPLIYNLIREGNHLKVQSLMDIEELIDEFDQRTICEGLASNEDVEEINAPKVAYKDGIKWRHVLCPLIVNNDSTRCSKCTTLTHALAHKSKESFSVPYTSIIFLKKGMKAHKFRHAKKRIRNRDRKYDFMAICQN